MTDPIEPVLSPQQAHTPVWSTLTERWECHTCGLPLIVCTEEELRYGFQDNPTRLIKHLTGKERPAFLRRQRTHQSKQRGHQK